MSAADLLARRPAARHRARAAEGSRVLDLGCGDGSLIAHLRDERGCDVRGIELAPAEIAAAHRAGPLGGRRPTSTRVSRATPTARSTSSSSRRRCRSCASPRFVLREMLRVGHARRSSRSRTSATGGARLSRVQGPDAGLESIPFSWYDTPNIHHTTLKDFRDFCSRLGLVIEREVPLRTSSFGSAKRVSVLPNLFADTALLVVRRA